jgi:peptidoglycan L-alanyl-D-glutamate endopeptidase CwlK
MIVPMRNSDPACLHPLFREKARELLERLTSESIPFRLFEGFRPPERQLYLYAQGRTRPGPIVTNARPWSSYHQYGLAGDFVLFENGAWSWDSSGARKRYWSRLGEIGKQLELEPLSFEAPHLQLAGLRIQELARAKYPAGGDPSWEATVKNALASWRKAQPLAA